MSGGKTQLSHVFMHMCSGAEGQRLMHTLKQPNLAPADTSQEQLDRLTQQCATLPDRQAVVTQKRR